MTDKDGVVLPVRVTVNAPVSEGLPSVALASATAIETLGSAGSSSVIVTAALDGFPTVYAAFGVSVTTTVSSPSATASLMVVTVIGAELCPAPITTLPDKL